MENQEVNITAKFPAGEDKTVFLQRVAQALRSEFGNSATVKVDDEESEVEIIDENWVEEETKKEEARKFQQEIDKMDIEINSLEAREYARQIPDCDLPSHAQLWDEARKYDLKIQMATEKLAEKEFKGDNSPQESERVRIYGRGSAY